MTAEFDRYENRYREEVAKATAFAGGDLDLFTTVKAEHLVAVWRSWFGETASLRVLDVGCGVGLTDALLIPHVGELHGVDVAPQTIERARRENPLGIYQSYDGSRLPYDDGAFDACFAICVFHHVPPENRQELVAEMARVTRPGGSVAILEHNPYNPLTRLVVSRCEFDEDAILLAPGEARSLLESARLAVASSSFLLFFPFRLGWLRALERSLGWLPAGAQYAVFASRPGAGDPPRAQRRPTST